MSSVTDVISYGASAAMAIPYSTSGGRSQTVPPPPLPTIDEALRKLARVNIRSHLEAMPKGAYLSADLTGMQGADQLLRWAAKNNLFWNPETGMMSEEQTPVAAADLKKERRNLSRAYREKMIIGSGVSSREQLQQVMERRASITGHVSLAELIGYIQERAASEKATLCEIVVPYNRVPDRLDQSRGYTEVLVSIDRMQAGFEQKVIAAQRCVEEKRIMGVSIEGIEETQPYSRQLRRSNSTVQQEWGKEGRVVIEAGGLTRSDADIHHLEEVLFKTVSLYNGSRLNSPLASRIRRPISFYWDKHKDEITQKMIHSHVVAEFCLTYEEQVLGCTPAYHPIKGMLERGIPVALSCGLGASIGSTLTDEFVKAFCDYGCTFEELKKMAYASLRCCASVAVTHPADDDFVFMDGDEAAGSAASSGVRELDPRVAAFQKQMQTYEDGLKEALGCR